MSSRRSRADDAACTHRHTDTHTRLYDVPHQLTAIDVPHATPLTRPDAALFCSVLQPSSIRRLATPWTYFLHLSLSSVILIDSSMESPVHVLMLSIQAVRGLPRLYLALFLALSLSPGNSLVSSNRTSLSVFEAIVYLYVAKAWFCSLAVVDPRVGHTMDVVSPLRKLQLSK